MDRVQPDEEDWSIERFFIALYEHSFPTSYRLSYRKKIVDCKQNGRTMKAWIRELRDMAGIIGDVTDHQMWRISMGRR